MVYKTKRRVYFHNTDDPDVIKKYTEGYYYGGAWVHSTEEYVPSRLAELKGKKVIGWKKAGWRRGGAYHYAMIELEIAARTPRVQPKNNKCRAASAKVLSIHECMPGKGFRHNHWKMTGRKLRVARSHHDNEFVYRVGARVKPLPVTSYICGKDNRLRKQRAKGKVTFVRDHRECAVGIHFFLTQKEAQRYAL